ncbi:(R,R)-butanediol dehydrogenase [Cercospora beticola]|uniref:(R,R)-butanediol dehydrogenase n=1 Tax=Cercospora beticola TaxID=122368 RepID=A0A2G5GJ28_CERBT|nr:(R,R)-butanediol dehydrogenase [Cercospora beticola]PIA80072.1 (R,R)-butanediol dehydrogenase [Cercospora beticola]WPB08486.1 hypothetical protein RHO25_013152 [Cercospora beticola]
MRAVRFYGKEDVRIVDDVDVPVTREGQVRIRPAFVGICGTDVHEYSRGATLIPESEHALTGRSVPLTLGHEISGVVDEVGAGVSHVQAGDRVAIQPIISDGTCYACQLDRPNCCAQQGFYGLSADGGLAEYLVVDASNARKLPAGVTLAVAALVEPLSVAWHAVRRSVTKDTSSVLVVGAGPIGLCIVQALKARRVRNIIVADTNSERRNAAITAGAHHFVDALRVNVERACAKLCSESSGVHVAFDTAGKQVTLDQCVAALCVGGTVVNVAVWGSSATIMPNSFLLSEKQYMGTSVYTREDFDEVIEAIASGLMNPEFLITSRIAMTEVVSRGILKMLHTPGSDLKTLVDLTMRGRL